MDGAVPRGRLPAQTQGGVAEVRGEEPTAEAGERDDTPGGCAAHHHEHSRPQVGPEQQPDRQRSNSQERQAGVHTGHNDSVPEGRTDWTGCHCVRAQAALPDYRLLPPVQRQIGAGRQRRPHRVADGAVGREGADVGAILQDGRVPAGDERVWGGAAAAPDRGPGLPAVHHHTRVLHRVHVSAFADVPGGVRLLQLSDLLAHCARISRLSGAVLYVTRNWRTDVRVDLRRKSEIYKKKAVKKYELIINERSSPCEFKKLFTIVDN